MIQKTSLCFFAMAGLSLTGLAQQKDKPQPVQFRAVFHDPVRPMADLYYTDKAGAVVKLNFRPQDLTETLLTMPLNGSLVLYDKEAVDPENPAASLAASARLPAQIKRAIVLVLPAPPGGKTAYRMRIIDDSEKAFPGGESLALSLVGAEIGIQAGEHRLTVEPGKMARVPSVNKVNEFNMAQTNFYYRKGDSWTVFTERQLQFLKVSRRLFIIHATPGALQPAVTTIVVTTPRAAAVPQAAAL